MLVRDEVVDKALPQFVPSSNRKTLIKNHAAGRCNKLSGCSTDKNPARAQPGSYVP